MKRIFSKNYITRDLMLGLQRIMLFITLAISNFVTWIVLLHRFDSKYNMYEGDYLMYLSNEALKGSGYWFAFVSIFLVLLFINNLQYLSNLVFKSVK